jgi:hypothetical protein
MNDQIQPLPQSYASDYQSLRLTFSYEGSRVWLVSQQHVEMALPPSDPLPEHGQRSGFWYEVQNEHGTIFYRRIIYNPIRFEAEIFSNDSKIPNQRIKIDNPRGTFQLLLPEIVGADSLVLYSSPLEPEFASQPATELARFSLKSRKSDEAIQL